MIKGSTSFSNDVMGPAPILLTYCTRKLYATYGIRFPTTAEFVYTVSVCTTTPVPPEEVMVNTYKGKIRVKPTNYLMQLLGFTSTL